MELTREPHPGDFARVFFTDGTGYVDEKVHEAADDGSWVLLFKGEEYEQRAVRDPQGEWKTEGSGHRVTFPVLSLNGPSVHRPPQIGDYVPRVRYGRPEVWRVADISAEGTHITMEPVNTNGVGYENGENFIFKKRTGYFWSTGHVAHFADGEEKAVLWAAARCTLVYVEAYGKYSYYERQLHENVKPNENLTPAQNVAYCIAEELSELLFTMETGFTLADLRDVDVYEQYRDSLRKAVLV